MSPHPREHLSAAVYTRLLTFIPFGRAAAAKSGEIYCGVTRVALIVCQNVVE